MKIMTEDELRAIDPEEFEGIDIAWTNGGAAQTGRLLFDYDQGFSLTDKDDPNDCLVGTQGPAYAGTRSNYSNKEGYHKKLTASFNMLKKGYFSCSEWCAATDRPNNPGGLPTCAFV